MIKNGLENKKLFLLDLDGTIYLENVLFDYSLEFLEYINEINGKYVFLTNNSSKSVVDYVSKLTHLGLQVDKTNFLTSAQAMAYYLEENYREKKVYVLGTESFKNELNGHNIQIADSIEDNIACVVVGYDTELTYSKLIEACKLLTDPQVDFIATNPDLVCPTSFGNIPDCGSFCKMIEVSIGREPVYIGKPNSLMVELAISKNGYSKGDSVLIGDRLYTDIACGINSQVTTALVLSGETVLADVENSPFKPDYIFQGVNEIYSNLIERKAVISSF